MTEILIVLTGASGSGKSTAARILAKYGFHEETFAGPLKEFALSIGFKHSEIYGTQAEKLAINEWWGISGREFMQKFGTEVCRNALPRIIPNMDMCGQSLWARAMVARRRDRIWAHKRVVISDCRFADEAEIARMNGGRIIHITRDDPFREDKTPVHESETAHLSFSPDALVANDGSIADLEASLLQNLRLFNVDIRDESRECKGRILLHTIGAAIIILFLMCVIGPSPSGLFGQP